MNKKRRKAKRSFYNRLKSIKENNSMIPKGKSEGMVLIFVLLSGLAFFLILGGRSQFMIIENRTPNPFPAFSFESVFKGEYSSAFEAWFSDNFPFREYLIKTGQSFDSIRGIRGYLSPELVQVKTNAEFDAGPEKNKFSPDMKNEDKFAEAQTWPPITISYLSENSRIETVADSASKNITEDDGKGQMVEGFLVLGNRAMEVVNFRQKAADSWAEAVNGFVRNLPEKTHCYAMIAPSSIALLNDERYNKLGAPQTESIQTFYQGLDERIVTVDALSALKSSGEEYLYFRTDHHWTPLGAYYAYTAFALNAGFTPQKMDYYSIKDIPGFLGTLYSKTLSPKLRASPDMVRLFISPQVIDFEYLREGATVFEKGVLVDEARANSGNKYLAYSGYDWPISIIRNPGVTTGEKLLVFKDSYGNALLPFLANHYAEIHVIDPRHYSDDASTYALEQNFDDILFENYFVIISWYDGFARNLKRITNISTKL